MLLIEGMIGMMLVKVRRVMAVMPVVSAALIHQIGMNDYSESNVVSTG